MQPRSTSPPLKRPRRAPSPVHSDANGHESSNEGLSLPPLSLSILGLEPLDEFIKEIADFVHHMIMTRPDQLHGKVEVEAKIGILRDRMSGQRLALPVLVETSICCFRIRLNKTAFVDWLPFFFLFFISREKYWLPILPTCNSSPICQLYVSHPLQTFIVLISAVFQHQHKHYNTLLNRLKTESSLPSHVGSPLDYSHRFLLDNFYAAEGNDKEKIRVTRDEKTGTTLECMRKLRLGNLNIYSPKYAADWRVSVNLEIPSASILFYFLSI